MGATTPEELLGMSDDDFMNELAPVVEPAAVKTPEEIAAEEAAAAAAVAAQDAEAKAAQDAAAEAEAQRLAAEAAASTTVPGSENKGNVTDNNDKAVVDPVTKTPEQLEADRVAAEAAATDKASAADNANTVDYQKAYELIMAPFKANGKTMQVNSPEEAIALMQMGANYTRKMQELQPQRKTLLMLENNGLLDADKLSFLIDVSKGDPEAIKKLLKDTKFDALQVDLEQESTYRGGNHVVSDAESNFRAVMDDLGSNPVGKETLMTINSTWDHASKEVLWNQPEIMNTIHAQRENGIYNRIVTEIDRKRTLGVIPIGTPFLQAYKQVGDELQSSGAFNDLIQQKPATQPAAVPVAKKAVLPKPTNVDPKVAAAAVHRGTQIKTETTVNPLNMSDDDFLRMPIPK